MSQYPLNETLSPIDRDERMKIVENWQRITSYFEHIQSQIKVLAGGKEVDELIKRIEEALEKAETEVSNYIAQVDNKVNEALGRVTTALNNVETLISQAQTVIEAANTATSSAETAAGSANAAAGNANAAAQSANEATSNATNAATTATNAANSANEKAAEAAAAALNANKQAEEAKTQAHNAENAMQDATTAASRANEAADQVAGWGTTVKWDAETQFEKNNTVSDEGQTWQAKRANKGVKPVEGADWTLIAKKGTDGIGSVASVNGVGPNDEGLVTLEAVNIPTDFIDTAKTSGYLTNDMYTFLGITNENVDAFITDAISSGLKYYTLISTTRGATSIKSLVISNEKVSFKDGDSRIYDAAGENFVNAWMIHTNPAPASRIVKDISYLGGSEPFLVQKYVSTFSDGLLDDLRKMNVQDKLEELSQSGGGEGTVKSVRGELPDAEGNVQLSVLDSKAEASPYFISEEEFMLTHKSGLYNVHAAFENSFFPISNGVAASFSVLLSVGNNDGGYAHIRTYTYLATGRITTEPMTFTSHRRVLTVDTEADLILEDSGWQELGQGGGSDGVSKLASQEFLITATEDGQTVFTFVDSLFDPINHTALLFLDAEPLSKEEYTLSIAGSTPTVTLARNDIPAGATLRVIVFRNVLVGPDGGISAAVLQDGTVGYAKLAQDAKDAFVGLNDLQTVESNLTTLTEETNAHMDDPDIHVTPVQKAGWDESTIVFTATGPGTAIQLPITNLAHKRMYTFYAIASNNGAATTINGYPLRKDATTTPVIQQGKTYTVWFWENYENPDGSKGSFFIKASAEGTATAANVLASKTFSNDSDTGMTGTMLDHSGKQLSFTRSTEAGGIFMRLTSNISGYIDMSSFIRFGDSNFVPENIISGKTIFGVTGTASTGRRFAQGNSTSSSSHFYFPITTGGQQTMYTVNIGTLPFLPSIVYVRNYFVNTNEFTMVARAYPYNNYGTSAANSYNSMVQGAHFTITLSSTQTIVPVYSANTLYEWFAWE